ncbi:MAG: hypothetical protein EBR29_07755 [Sphingobacteriia bacterium]|nr:hypothetical protein [Sphingobacteriia bacterium]
MDVFFLDLLILKMKFRGHGLARRLMLRFHKFEFSPLPYLFTLHVLKKASIRFANHAFQP